MLNFTQLLSHVLLFTGTHAVPVDCDEEQPKSPTVYTAWTRPLVPNLEQQEQIQGLNQPLRQNGSWIDVGIWISRPEITSLPPFLFTLGPGHDSDTHTIVQYRSEKKLAYSEGDVKLDVNYGSLAAFVLTEGDGEMVVGDGWTVEKDKFGRRVLGLSKGNGGDGEGWMMQGCAWNVGDLEGCDGFYFMWCSGCFGTEVVIELVEHNDD